MDYEQYYNDLLAEIGRSVELLKEYYEVEPTLDDHRKSFLYQVFIIDAVPNGIQEVIKIITQGEWWYKIDSNMGIHYEDNKTSPFVTRLFEALSHNPTLAIDTFKRFAEISGNVYFIELLENIRYDLKITEHRLKLLKQRLSI